MCHVKLYVSMGVLEAVKYRTVALSLLSVDIIVHVDVLRTILYVGVLRYTALTPFYYLRL